MHISNNGKIIRYSKQFEQVGGAAENPDKITKPNVYMTNPTTIDFCLLKIQSIFKLMIQASNEDEAPRM